MQYLTLASLFAAALAAPAPAPQTTPTPDCPNPAHCPQNGLPNPDHYENINITDWSLRKNNGTIQSVYFKLSGDNATDLVCERGVIPSLPAPVVTCGDSDYRFDMVAPNSEWNDSDDFGLAIYHQTSPAAGKYDIGAAPPSYCHAGGNGPNDFICAQVAPFTFVITS